MPAIGAFQFAQHGRHWLGSSLACQSPIERSDRMHFLPTERVALFIDGANLYSASRNLGFDVDYRNLLEYFRKQGPRHPRLLLFRRAGDRGILAAEAADRLAGLQRLHAGHQAGQGIHRRRRPAPGEGQHGHRAGDRHAGAGADKIDHAVLFSGDSDFRRLVEAVQRKGVRVSVVSSIRTTPADGRRRIAPPGRPVPGTGGNRARIHPPADRAADAPGRPRCAQTPAEPFADSPDAA